MKFSHLFRNLSILTTPPRENHVPIGIPESQAVMCDACHMVVSMRGVVIHANSGDRCPRCGSDNLKYLPAWIRTPEEQKAHWEGRKVKMPKRKPIPDTAMAQTSSLGLLTAPEPSIEYGSATWPPK